MRYETSFTVPAPPERVWTVFSDPARVAACVPGCRSVTAVDATHCQAEVQVSLAFLNLTFRVTAHVRIERPGRELVVDVVADPIALAGGVRSQVRLHLESVDLSLTNIILVIDTRLSGRLASLGEAMLREALTRNVEQFAENLRAVLVEV